VRRSSPTGLFLAVLLISLTPASRAQQFYATSESTGRLELIDLPNQTITTVYTAAGRPDSILVNSRGQLIYDLSPQGVLALYDPAAQTNTVLLSNLKGPRDLLFDVPTTCNPNANADTMLVALYGSGQIIRYDFTSGTFSNLGPQLGSKATGFSVDGLAYDAEGNLFAVANHNTVVQMDPCTGDILKTLVLEPHYKIDGGDGMVYDPYSGQLWISHDGSNNANGLIEVPTDLSSFSLFQSGQIPVPDGIISDGKGNLYIGAGLQRLMVYNIPTDTLAHPSSQSLLVPGIDSLALIPGTPTSTSLTTFPNPSVVGQSVAMTASITPVPAGAPPLGTVSFYNGSTVVGTAAVNASGVATFATSSLPSGPNLVKATYSGNMEFAASVSPVSTQTVTGTSLTSTSTTTSASPNPAAPGESVLLTATVAPAPTGSPLGTVSFFNHSTQLSTADLNSSGVATFRTSALPPGSNSITAAYSGNASFAESTSSGLTLTVGTAASFTVAGPETPVTVAAGGSVDVQITVTPVGGALNGAVAFSASGLPAGASASFSPATVTPGGSAASTMMTIQTPTAIAALPANRKSEFPFLAMFVAAGLCLIARKHGVGRSLPILLALAMSAGASVVMTGCGGGGMSVGPPQSRSYVITVTGTSVSSPGATARFTLIVR